MLETEQEENQEKEREKRKQILHSQELKKQKKKNRLLFGDTGRFNINFSNYVWFTPVENCPLTMCDGNK